MNPFDSPIISSGPDKGKTEEQLHAEVFDPNVSDLDYFKSRCRAHGIAVDGDDVNEILLARAKGKQGA